MQRLLRFLLVFVGLWPLALLHGVGFCLGCLLWWIPNGLKRRTIFHVELCLRELPPNQRQRIARHALIESMKALMEAPAIWFGPARRLQRWLGTP
ncbi:MAG TPA: hypothetical protein VFQ88_03770, partial [Nevskiaceae bacterium]|nr:hypothetical protein [Nevskiaceae bacterium]